ADYTVETAPEKLRSGQPRSLDLEPTPKLIDEVRAAHPDLPIVGFKAETAGDDDAMVARAIELRDRVGLAFVVANDASVMGGASTRALVVGPEAETAADCEVVGGEKAALGDVVARRLAAHLSASD
ncbi:MAG: phosphopantothenoylcysteine decarboxylase, partial [Natrialbaceae archaeon]